MDRASTRSTSSCRTWRRDSSGSKNPTTLGARYVVVEDPEGNAVGLMSPVDPTRAFRSRAQPLGLAPSDSLDPRVRSARDHKAHAGSDPASPTDGTIAGLPRWLGSDVGRQGHIHARGGSGLEAMRTVGQAARDQVN